MDEYVKHNFEDGQVLHAQALNEMDDAIGEVKEDLSEVKEDKLTEAITITPESVIVYEADAYQRAYRKGNVVFMNISFRPKSFSERGYVSIGTFPKKYAPITDVYFVLIERDGRAAYMAYIHPDGIIYLYARSDLSYNTDMRIRGSVSYVIGK